MVIYLTSYSIRRMSLKKSRSTTSIMGVLPEDLLSRKSSVQEAEAALKDTFFVFFYLCKCIDKN